MATSNGFSPEEVEGMVDGALSLLTRVSALGRTVFRDGFGDFRGKKNDTINLRLPAYAKASKRQLRSSTARVRTKLHERTVPVTLTHGYQIDVPLTDEEITLDVRNLARDVIAPSVAGIAREYETDIANLMETATYARPVIDIDASSPYSAVVEARKQLSDGQVPLAGLFLAVGSSVEAALLESEQFRRFDQAGDSNAFRRAETGMIANFTVVPSQALDPEVAIAYHRTAFAVATRAPIVPDGAAWGATQSADGYAIRVMQHLSDTDDGPTNIVYHDAWVGLKAVTDVGAIDETTGKFEPAVDPEESGADDLFVRAVKLELAS